MAGVFTPCLISSVGEPARLGDRLVDEYLRFTAARVRPNSLLAQGFDLKVFFAVVAKPPLQVDVADVLGFIEEQRTPRRGGNVFRLSDGEAGLAASTIKRRLATISSFFDYLLLRGMCDRNPVPRSINARHRGHRGAPLVRAPKKLPRVLLPEEVVALTSALRSDRDRAMISLMVHAGLRRCEVLGLRFGDSILGIGGCSSLTARAATSAWSRSSRRSSPTWPTTWLLSVPATRPVRARTACSCSSRASLGTGR